MSVFAWPLLIVFLLFWAVVLGGVLFIGWVIVKGARGMDRGERQAGEKAMMKCPRQQCRAVNPAEALFCRRCGIRLPMDRKRRAKARQAVAA